MTNDPRDNGKDIDPQETNDWLASLADVLERSGPERAKFLLNALDVEAHRRGVDLPYQANTPYVNTIPRDEQPPFPGSRELERRIKSIIRWNAMAMVVRANKEHHGIGGHISTFASIATIYEIGYNHFFRARGEDFHGDMVYFQGHATPGNYARAFLEGRLTETHLRNFRRELQPEGGLSSYPHPWLMPDFWEFPTVSMGLGPLQSIYQARFSHYLEDRGFKDTRGEKVWAFVGDGESDEPETLGAITLAAREKLDNLVWVVDCNLQRLDGPVRGNGKIIQELEGAFRGAGWRVIKVVWGSDWDPLLESEQGPLLIRRMGEAVDGDYQKYAVAGADYIREHFFGKYPELAELAKQLSDEQLVKMKRGGHDPEKVYAAFKAAVETQGQPCVVLCKTIKGYGQGEAGEGRNVAHNQKKLNEEELREFRSRFGIPISDEKVAEAPFYKPPADSPEMQYLHKRREELGGFLPGRPHQAPPMAVPSADDYKEFREGSGDREVSTTMAFVRFLGKLLKDEKVGKNIVPIVPDESRTFGMEALFRQVGIYSHVGQLYEPVDSDTMLYYKEATDGQILEEGITEAGCMASFIAAGTSHYNHGVNMIPVFIYYSMFGFQRVGDLIWAAGDSRAKGFMLGGTAGRTTLNGEGLQHQDGHSLLWASAYPTVRSYDPAFAYEVITLFMHGLKEMYADGKDLIYYLTLYNENYKQAPMPEDKGIEEGIIRGIYKFRGPLDGRRSPQANLFGSGPILREAIRAQEILSEQYDIATNVWSVTSYNELARDCRLCDHHNFTHPDDTKRPYVVEALKDSPGPIIAASDYVRAVPQQICSHVPGIWTLGTDGYGRSETRETLRRFYEIDAECIALCTLERLAWEGEFDAAKLPQAMKDLGIEPQKLNPLTD
jgi:pyruvate dehydrogenase E1 component